MTFMNLPKHRQIPFLGDDASIWSGIDPEAAALAAKVAYGPEATLAVALCAVCAKIDGRFADGHYWFEVFCLLRTGEISAIGNSGEANSADTDGILQ
ncbi:hypothetical protein [Rhizobium sp. BR 314]|uniref:hypothetical protein n=1 Tax=Rhizobium sp. BR 314 TaxID=3040013 RepID=UPI0039BF8AE1